MCRSSLVAALLCLGLAACDGGPPEEAAKSAKRLVSAAWADDVRRFEAELDRPQVREDLRRQVVRAGLANGIEVEGGPSDRVLDLMVGPQAVRRRVDERLAQGPTEAIRDRLKVLDDGRACLPDADGVCVLTFARRGGKWRLVGLKAPLPPQPL